LTPRRRLQPLVSLSVSISTPPGLDGRERHRHNNLIASHGEVQRVWKSRHQGPPLVTVNQWKAQRLVTDPGQCLVECRTKLFAESGLSTFVPALGLEQLVLGLRPKNDGARH
jgi:hypothetical protein